MDPGSGIHPGTIPDQISDWLETIFLVKNTRILLLRIRIWGLFEPQVRDPGWKYLDPE